jgi:hypothetical protein
MRKLLLCCLCIIFSVVGCVVLNVNVTFPEKKIEQVAEDLLAPPQDLPSSFLPHFFAKNLYAQEVVEVKSDIKTNSPVIREAKRKMDSWWVKLNDFKKKGFVGEKNSFEVELRETPSDVSIAKEVRQIISNENRERRVMMNELLKINNVAPSEREKFKQIFAKVVQRNSPKSTWIQTEQGLWQRK